MKKVTFEAKRSGTRAFSADDLKVMTQEPTKRFTIDVPISLHRRVKSQCAISNLVMADVVRELLEQRFPAKETPGQGTS